MKEIDLMREIQLAATDAGHRLFRNNVANGWVGVFAGRSPDGTVVLKSARPLHAGLTLGSSDLIGWTSSGRFLAVEVKSDDGQPSEEQKRFLRAVNAAGGIGVLAYSIQDVDDAIGQWDKK